MVVFFYFSSEYEFLPSVLNQSFFVKVVWIFLQYYTRFVSIDFSSFFLLRNSHAYLHIHGKALVLIVYLSLLNHKVISNAAHFLDTFSSRIIHALPPFDYRIYFCWVCSECESRFLSQELDFVGFLFNRTINLFFRRFTPSVVIDDWYAILFWPTEPSR